MAIKPAANEVLEETKRTRIVSASESSEDKEKRPPWYEVAESLKPTNPEKPEYEFTIYRGTHAQRASEKTWIGKFYEPMTPHRIQGMFGGGQYNIWLKMGPGMQLKYNEDLKIEGTPRIVDNPVAAPALGDATTQIIAMFREELRSLRDELKTARGGDLGMEAVKQALTLNGQVFTSAAQSAVGTLQAIAQPNPAAHAPNPMEGVMTQFMTAAIAKMLNPADPIENFAKMAQAMSTLGVKLGGPGAGEGKLIDKLAIGLVNQLPSLASHVSGIMDTYRRAEEAKAQQAALLRGVTLPPAPQPQPPVAQPSNVLEMPRPAEELAAAPQPGAQPTQEQLMAAEQMLQYIEQKIVELFNDPTNTPEEAASKALQFIDITDPVKNHPDGQNLIDQVLKHGEVGLRWLFSTRPILKQIPSGERLEKFIRAFLDGGRNLPVQGPAPDPAIPPA